MVRIKLVKSLERRCTIENLERKHDELMCKGKVNEAISMMLDCMLSQNERKCKNCNDVSVCCFITEAVFAFRSREIAKSSAF